ncbi:MAG: hypothetical protein CVU36_09200 [Betaproteobacteria bacterium HGW-Betaproteobacteria-9]|nr:MAG: hypothetical protein CVU36_09200 [Betaproteobacteria bacterium HGW-Betaproteobacteria-9]
MKKILLVSSSKGFLKRNTTLLAGRELSVFTVSSGEEALKLHEELVFDLILSELELEGMDGSRLCSEVHMAKNSQLVPVILICYDRLDSIQRVEQSGANALILKPIDPIQLLETIGSFIDMQIGKSKRVVLNVKVITKKSELEFFCFSHDISNTGILLESEYQLSLGDKIVCAFNLDDTVQIEAAGEVIRCMSMNDGKNLYGVKFSAIPLSYRKAIDSYIDSLPSPSASKRSAISD